MERLPAPLVRAVKLGRLAVVNLLDVFREILRPREHLAASGVLAHHLRSRTIRAAVPSRVSRGRGRRARVDAGARAGRDESEGVQRADRVKVLFERRSASDPLRGQPDVMDGGDAEAPGGEEHRLPERAGLPAEVHPSRRGPRGVEWWWSSSSFVRLNHYISIIASRGGGRGRETGAITSRRRFSVAGVRPPSTPALSPLHRPRVPPPQRVIARRDAHQTVAEHRVRVRGVRADAVERRRGRRELRPRRKKPSVAAAAAAVRFERLPARSRRREVVLRQSNERPRALAMQPQRREHVLDRVQPGPPLRSSRAQLCVDGHRGAVPARVVLVVSSSSASSASVSS